VIQIGNSNWNTWVDIHNDMYVWGYVSAANLYNRSLESLKKDINKSSIKAIDEVKNTDIYTYRLKEEKDNSKKHFGIVIGDKYNYSKEIVNQENNAVDLYSMISILWKAVQEQQGQIEKLQNEIKEMKGE
jgi:asparagine N-glycosylation enzyme membrane subunit Stt3